MEQVRQVWATFAERTQALPADQLRLVAVVACLAFILVLVAWVGALRKLRRISKKLIEAQAQSQELQAKYDAEVKWRTAIERVEAAKMEQTAPAPAAPPEPAQQPAGVVASASDQGLEIKETIKTEKANTLRVLSLVTSVVALAGWGTFAYTAKSSATAQHQLREEVTQLKATQDQLLAERDQARAQVAAARQEVEVLQKRLEERPRAGDVPTPAASGNPVRSPTQTKRESRQIGPTAR